jgi:hypothetical protein
MAVAVAVMVLRLVVVTELRLLMEEHLLMEEVDRHRGTRQTLVRRSV